MLRTEIHKVLAQQPLAVRVQPGEAGAETILRLGIAGHHEINKLGDARFARARRAVAGDDHVGKPLDQGVLCRTEKLRIVHRGLDLQGRIAHVAAGKRPLAEAGKLRDGGCRP